MVKALLDSSAGGGCVNGSQFSTSRTDVVDPDTDCDTGVAATLFCFGVCDVVSVAVLSLLILELGGREDILASLGRSRRFGPGDASRESVCKNDDLRFLSVSGFSLNCSSAC